MTRDELVTLMSADMFTLDELLAQRPAWHADAACRQHPEVNYFPTLGENTAPAKQVCAGCPVRAECLAEALQDSHTVGVWGGTSERERRRLRRHAA